MGNKNISSDSDSEDITETPLVAFGEADPNTCINEEEFKSIYESADKLLEFIKHIHFNENFPYHRYIQRLDTDKYIMFNDQSEWDDMIPENEIIKELHWNARQNFNRVCEKYNYEPIDFNKYELTEGMIKKISMLLKQTPLHKDWIEEISKEQSEPYATWENSVYNPAND